MSVNIFSALETFSVYDVSGCPLSNIGGGNYLLGNGGENYMRKQLVKN